MEIPKLIILLCCTTICLASHHTHIIPVEGYETKLQDLGEHVNYHETPVRVVKITKTVAVKIPVPYPVKVVEKVPYPVHVNKPYPVPVPHIVKVPVSHESNYGQEAVDIGHGNQLQNRQYGGNSYQVQEAPHDISAAGKTYGDSNIQSYGGGNNENNYGFNGEEHNSGGSYYAPPSQDIHGFSDDQDNSFESKSYDQAVENYLKNLKPHENFGGSEGYH